MKSIGVLTFLLFIFTIASCDRYSERKTTKSNADINAKIDTSRLSDLTFDQKIIDLGSLKKIDSIIEVEYNYKNISQNPLIIEYVKPDCSCTSARISNDTLKSEGEGTIFLNYNISEKIGDIRLDAIVKANTETRFYKLTLKLEVLE